MDELIRNASELQTASGVAGAVLELTNKDDFVVKDLVSLLEHDPALTARVLSAVNSSRFGLTRQISNLQQAVTHLGQRALRTIVLSFSILNTMSKGVDEKIYREFWRRSLTTSLVANRLSQTDRAVDANDAYVAGLLADIGILSLAQFVPDKYVPIYEKYAHGPELVRAEREALGFDHAEFGACLLEVWQFPQILSSAVTSHHDEKAAERLPLIRCVHVSNLMPDAIWLAQTSALQTAFSSFEYHFQFSIPQFIELALEVNQAVAREAQEFQIGGFPAINDETLEIIREGYGLTKSKRRRRKSLPGR